MIAKVVPLHLFASFFVLVFHVQAERHDYFSLLFSSLLKKKGWGRKEKSKIRKALYIKTKNSITVKSDNFCYCKVQRAISISDREMSGIAIAILENEELKC